MTDTPIYDQIRHEIESAGSDQLTARRTRSSDEPRKAVSVWSLVDQHQGGRRR
jgi:hypothetical protein